MLFKLDLLAWRHLRKSNKEAEQGEGIDEANKEDA